MSAALIGSGVGACLGAVFLAGGMAHRIEAQEAAPAPVEHLALRGPLPAEGENMVLAAGGGESVRAPLPPMPQPQPKPTPAQPYKAAARGDDLECLTTAVYFEARGEGAKGQQAVAQVVLNRVRHPAFPQSVCGVVYQGCQFSFACNGAMKARRETDAWRNARQVASRALSGFVMAEVGNATHFHARYVQPQWGPQLSRVAEVGLHVFYRLGRGGGGGSAPAKPPEPGLYEYARLDRSQEAAESSVSRDVRYTSAPLPTPAAEPPTEAKEADDPARKASPQPLPAEVHAKPATDTAVDS